MGPDALRALALLAAFACAGCGGTTAKPTVGSAAVLDSARDGDTILLENGRRVRLVQVDAPELGVECHGDASLATLERIVPPGTRLRLERDPVLDDEDNHGRLLRYAYAGDRNVNLELVRRGAAAPYFYRGLRGRHAHALLDAAAEARAARRGLWGACPGTRLRPTRAVVTGEPR